LKHACAKDEQPVITGAYLNGGRLRNGRKDCEGKIKTIGEKIFLK